MNIGVTQEASLFPLENALVRISEEGK